MHLDEIIFKEQDRLLGVTKIKVEGDQTEDDIQEINNRKFFRFTFKFLKQHCVGRSHRQKINKYKHTIIYQISYSQKSKIIKSSQNGIPVNHTELKSAKNALKVNQVKLFCTSFILICNQLKESEHHQSYYGPYYQIDISFALVFSSMQQ